MQNMFRNIFRCLSATEAACLKVEIPDYFPSASGQPIWAYLKADVHIWPVYNVDIMSYHSVKYKNGKLSSK